MTRLGALALAVVASRREGVSDRGTASPTASPSEPRPAHNWSEEDDELVVVHAGEVRFDPELECRQPDLLESGDRRLG
jgi:hypothetical protein